MTCAPRTAIRFQSLLRQDSSSIAGTVIFIAFAWILFQSLLRQDSSSIGGLCKRNIWGVLSPRFS